MPRVLYIGGSGEISFACVEAAVKAGHQVTVFNRGRRSETLPAEVEHIIGDARDDSLYAELASRRFDSVCQFIAYDPVTIGRDIEMFTGYCGQYVFISSASAYQKSSTADIITEETPLENPFWEYSRMKAACESLLHQAHTMGKLPVTIVRPSHTYRTRLPGTCIPGDHMAWRILNEKPIVVHGDGQSLWTMTHSDDFARAFVKLCGNERALGEAFHITRENAQTWNEIVAMLGSVLAHTIRVAHVSTDRLVNYKSDWLGPLKGDKSNSAVFDNSKVREAVGGWQCEISLEEGLQKAATFTKDHLALDYTPDDRLDALIDQIIADHYNA